MRKGRSARVALVRAIVLTIAAVFTVNACGSFSATTGEITISGPTELPAPAPAPAPAASPQLIPFQTVPPSTTIPEPLGIPIAIPFESYVPEAVVPYGAIEIPKIGLVHKLFEGVTLHNIDEGPSHWPGTATPGKRGNAVFAGHRVTRSAPFRRVNELSAGDQVIFRVAGTRSVYRVTETLVVWPDATWIADQTDEPMATLYACHPPGSAAQRIVVKMALVSTGADAAVS